MRANLKLFILLSLAGCVSGMRTDLPSREASLIWMGHEGSCTGPDCCIKGDPGGDCVLPELYTVQAPDGTHTEQVHYIMKQRNGASHWGLADAKGNTIIEPKYDDVMAVSSQALLDKNGNFIQSSGKTRLSKIGIQTISTGGIPMHFAILKEYKDYRRDIAPILPNGKLGTTIKGAIAYHGGAAGFSVGPFSVITAAPALTGVPRSSVLLDVSGHVIWAGRELRVHQVNNSLRTAGLSPGAGDQNVAALVVGPAPIRISASDPNMYHPVGTDGLPIELPEGVIGVVPFGVHDAYSLDNGPSGADEVNGWVVVEKHGDRFMYRVGGGSDLSSLDVLRSAREQTLLDDVRLVFSAEFPKGVVVGHRAAKKDWVGFVGQYRKDGGAAPWIDKRQGINDGDDLLAAKTPDAAAALLKGHMDRKRNEVVANIAAAEAKRDAENAAAAAAREAAIREQEARRLAWAQGVLAQYGSDCPGDWSTCRMVAEASVIVGEPAITMWLEKHGSYGAPMEDACRSHRASERACGILADQSANVAAEMAQKDQARRNWEQAFRDAAAPRETSVTVQYYEGGRLQTKKMTMDRYNAVYGNGN